MKKMKLSLASIIISASCYMKNKLNVTQMLSEKIFERGSAAVGLLRSTKADSKIIVI